MTEIAIAVEQVDKRFGRTTVLAGVDLEVPVGQCCGILGENGSGKTTLLRCLVGLVRPTAGRVSVLGRELYPHLGTLPYGLGAIIEQPGLLERLTGRQNLELLASLSPTPVSGRVIDGVMERVGLDPRHRGRVATYSLGQRQRLALAQALMERPRLLILDEPQYGLDPKGVAMVRGIIAAFQAEGGTTVMVSHHQDEVAALCDVAYTMQSGRPVVANRGPS